MRARRVCALLLALLVAVAVGCTGGTDEAASTSSRTAPPARQYWPTAGWRRWPRSTA